MTAPNCLPGMQVGAFLCNHPDVASVHLTGSAATYDAIVWQGKPKVQLLLPLPHGVGAGTSTCPQG